MESIEQPFDTLGRLRQDETNDKLELIDESSGQKQANGSSPEAENSPLHQSNRSTNSILHGPQNHGLRVIIVSSIVFALAVTVALILTIFLEPKQVHGHAAVSCEDSRCSDQGLLILRQGGNAVDAAVATAFCLAVVNPAHAGLGGGGFALIHDHKFQKSWGYDFREQAPEGSSPDMIMPGQDKMLAVGIPGFVKGLHDLHIDKGVLPWKDVVDPAVDLAGSGVGVSVELAHVLEHLFTKGGLPQGPLRTTFTLNGVPKSVNDTFIMTGLASTLMRVRDNPHSFYLGSLAADLASEIRGAGGIITKRDMANYQVKPVEVIESKLKELTVLGLSAPAGGVQVALMLNMIDNLGWKKDQAKNALTYHQLIETYKFGYAHRSLLGDPATEPGMGVTMQALLEPQLAKDLVARIDNNRTYEDPAHYGGGLTVSDKGTSHISVIDSSELMVSLTLSINDYFGNGVMLPNTGIILNNELMDFNQNSSSPNGLAPGKRPLSSMAPTIIINKEHPCNHRIILGGQGGMKITTAIVETVANSVMFKMNVSKAVASPRIHNELLPTDTFYEPGISEEVLSSLRAKGHTLKQQPITAMSPKVFAIEKTNDDVRAYADFRAQGGPAAHF